MVGGDVKIITLSYFPHDELFEAWLKHVKEFDNKHADCEFVTVAAANNSTIDEAIAMIKSCPDMKVQAILKKGTH